MALSVSILADSKFPIDRKRLRAALTTAWEGYGLDGEVIVSVAVVGTRKMAELQEHYLGKEGPCDVLSFSQQDVKSDEFGFVSPSGTPLELGDIVLCYPLALDQAAKMGVLVDDRIEALALHGFRNLFGAEEESKFKIQS